MGMDSDKDSNSYGYIVLCKTCSYCTDLNSDSCTLFLCRTGIQVPSPYPNLSALQQCKGAIKNGFKCSPMLHFGHNVKYIKGDIDGTCKWTFSVIVIPEWRVDPSSVDMFSRITFRIAHSATVYTVIVSQRIYRSRFGGDNPGLSSNCRRSLDITTTFIKQHDGIYV